MNAVNLLENDHRQVEALFQQYASEGDLPTRRRVAAQILAELLLHAELEEEYFYPAARTATLGSTALTDASVADHATMRAVIGRLQAMPPDDAAYHPTMEQLQGLVEHHVDEEESELIPKVSEALGSARLESMGAAMEEAKRASALRR